MTEVHPTTSAHARKACKPEKPHKDFPLFAHATRRWAKKVRGKLFYFGPWDKPQEALERWLAEKDDLLAGRVPRSRKASYPPTLRDLCNQFLSSKGKLRDSGELSPRSWSDYHAVCEELVEMFGRDRLLTDLLPEDFERLRTKWAQMWGPVRVGNQINKTRVVFNYGYKGGLLDRPMRYGEGFNRPSQKTLRLARAEKGPQMFEAHELRRMIDKASQPMKAMLLLAINAGMGNNDVGQMPLNSLDLERAWMNYPRPKTGIARRCSLWPETVKALRDWLGERPVAKDEANANLVFITSQRGSWAKDTSDNPVSKETRKLLDSLSISGNRSFYAIRHTFETIAGESKDQIAVNAIMGHVDNSMSAAYRERISDARLRAVAEHVRRWLFAVGDKRRAKKRVANHG